jgi:ADP-heptose:LPS heptosyltransferase
VTSVLIVRPGALGDAVVTLPLLDALLAAGSSRLTLLGTPASWAFLAPDQSLVDVRDVGGRDWLGLFGDGIPLGPAARAVLARTDAAIVLLGPRRRAVEHALAMAGVARIVGASPGLPVYGTVSWCSEPGASPAQGGAPERLPECQPDPFRAPWPPGEAHAASRLFAALAGLTLPGGPPRWPRPPVPTDLLLRPTRDELGRAVHGLGLEAPPTQGLLAIHPGSGSAKKCWPVERFAALAAAAARGWGLRPLFLLGPAEEGLGPALAAALPAGLDAAVVRNPSLRHAFALLSLARAYVGNDSGITHLAARATPTLALFGPTDPRVWHPLGARVVTLSAPEGRLESLTVERALAALALVL